jgi:hypothetical protein
LKNGSIIADLSHIVLAIEKIDLLTIKPEIMNHNSNHIGVWMDHHIAHLIYPKGKDQYAIESVESAHDIHPRIDGQGADGINVGKYRASNNEFAKHNREQNELHDYYHMLKKVLEKYDEILLFGPTTAKDEFFNFLFEDKSFNGKKISIENSDKMSENQMMSFVKDYFAEEVRK